MQIVFEDEEKLVLCKPPGLSTTWENSRESVSGWLDREFAWAKGLDRAGVCHRLDKDTSGLVLVAKKQEVLVKLKSLFANREIKKEYTALVCGKVPDVGLASIKVPIGKSNFFAKRKVVIDGRLSETSFQVVNYYKDNRDRFFTLVRIYPKTGRTHQIRVHFAYMGWPLVGDRMYGGDCAVINRQFLHASGLSFVLLGKEYSFKSNLFADLEEALERYEKV